MPDFASDPLDLDQAQICLVDKGTRLKRMARVLPCHVAPGQAPEFRVDERINWSNAAWSPAPQAASSSVTCCDETAVARSFELSLPASRGMRPFYVQMRGAERAHHDSFRSRFPPV